MADALILVDVQNDFCHGGALAVPGGDEIIPPLNAFIDWALERDMPIFASRDWHPARSTHFAQFGGTWPVHCVQNTPGAAFHPDLRLPAGTSIVSAGTGENDEGYSAFEGTLEDGRTLEDVLRAAGVNHVYVGGLATDYCVRATALTARDEGLAVTLLRDTCRPVDLKPGDGAAAEAEMATAGVEFATSATITGAR